MSSLHITLGLKNRHNHRTTQCALISKLQLEMKLNGLSTPSMSKYLTNHRSVSSIQQADFSFSYKFAFNMKKTAKALTAWPSLVQSAGSAAS